MRQVTLSTDKDKYGIRLRAEPDHMVLGKRLKGAFKPVMTAIKELKSEQLEKFQKTGVWKSRLLTDGRAAHLKKRSQKDFRILMVQTLPRVKYAVVKVNQAHNVYTYYRGCRQK